MKTIAELAAIRDKYKNSLDLRNETEAAKRVVVGMATCGIAAGARPVLNTIVDEVAKQGIEGVAVTQTGCIGMCQYEPIVEVYEQGKEKVTYVHVDSEKAKKIVEEHIKNGHVIAEYTIGR